APQDPPPARQAGERPVRGHVPPRSRRVGRRAAVEGPGRAGEGPAGLPMEQAPDLADWQRDVIEIVRNEMLYFVPQMQTKILNEGWASYWHQRIVRDLELSDREYVEFARMNAGVLAPSRHELNPYHVGLKVLEDVERRW